ncbi:SAM-dependent methyltransferase [Halanaerobiaceae bacterium Z-7014]|uniref:SAM-dependent methyltransferase n=1 Tax=Halonatronomonas betaini TaxID=2778430 RepID=A0A931ASS4_9FIRM|nr:TrmO family methyltransferase [Halonatronomonas betaini]MBF8435541.1 SAM-dependent methyltransferase [Halonatronomonas betaini]
MKNKLLSRDDNILKVKGLDAINETPVLDIRPFAENYDCPS